MQDTGTSGSRPGPAKCRSKLSTALALTGVSLVASFGIQVAGDSLAGATTPTGATTGFTRPFSGTPRYVHLAPREITKPAQLNQPIGQKVADQIATKLGLSRGHVFTQQQYREFVTGRGVGGDPADTEIVDRSVRIFTNTTAHPLYSDVDGKLTASVLASYGLFVNKSGLLESLANSSAPTRKANALIAPGGYFGTWCRANGATAALAMLYKSGYTSELPFGIKAQQVSGVAQLVTNKRHGTSIEVGMSMAPLIWLVNFALLYVLNPAVAAKMPARWSPIPSSVANAILASPTGQVPYSEYAAALG